MSYGEEPFMPGPSQPKPRQWDTDLVEPIVEDGQVVGLSLDREASHQLFADLESILFRMGGGALIGAQREKQDDGTYVTVGYRVSVESFMPPVSRSETPSPPPPPAPAPPPPVEPDEPAPAADYQPGEDEPGPPPVSALDGTEPREPEPVLEQG